MIVKDYLQPKSVDEILDKLREVIHRYRRKYIRSYLRPCPNNCTLAHLSGNRVVGCKGCKSHNPERCTQHEVYQAISTKEELALEFRNMLRDKQILQRDYPAIAVFLWVLGQLDQEVMSERVIAEVEER
jgi:hypothetical protein